MKTSTVLKLLLTSTLGLSLTTTFLVRPAAAGGFVNAGFEDGNFNGWTQGSGYWYGTPPLPVDPDRYQVGGSDYNASADASAITHVGDLDPIVGNLIKGGVGPTVYIGDHAVRVNNQVNNYSVSTIRQSVKNYMDNNIYFAWASVLEASHGSTDSDYFSLTLKDDTVGDVLISRVYNSYNNGSIFKDFGTGWFYTDQWQVEQLDLQALGRVGNDFTLTLLGSDCPYGGHAGYVYLDGFGKAPPKAVPEPASVLGLLAIGVLGAGSVLKRKLK